MPKGRVVPVHKGLVDPATTGPCAQCPWRVENRGRRHPDGWYTMKNLRRLWGGMRRGERMTCHPTDPDNPVPEGGREVPEGTQTRECAGMQILVQREIQRLNDTIVAGGTFADYRRANPRGLTRDGAAEHISAHLFAGTPLGGLEATKVNLNDESVVHPDLVPWETREVEDA